jgi:hypothetical protein
MRTRPIDIRLDRILETSRPRHNAVLSRSLDCNYLGFALPGSDNVANVLPSSALASGEACDTVPFAGSASSSPTMPKLCSRPSSRTIVTVFPNWTAALSGSMETSCAVARRAPSGACECAAVARRLGRAVVPARGLQRGVDQHQTVAGDKIWVLRNRPIRQILDEMIFVYKCSAHRRNMGISQGGFYTRAAWNRSARAAFPKRILPIKA